MRETVLFTLLQALTVAGFLLVGVAAVHLLVRALRAEHDGRLRERDARLVLAGAAVLFVVGFAQVVGDSVVGGVESASLAAVVLGFCGVTYLLYTARPGLFEVAKNDGESATDDGGSTD
jgi:hypothetical protein